MGNSREFVLKDQLLRATLSISNNIAEGFGRGGKKEFLYFLKIAHCSCYEVESMLYIMSDLSKLDKNTEDEIRADLVDIYNKISAMMSGIKKKIETESKTNKK